MSAARKGSGFGYRMPAGRVLNSSRRDTFTWPGGTNFTAQCAISLFHLPERQISPTKGGAAMAAGKVIAVNRKARHDYFVLETFETGIELAGTEVKSIRAGGVNLKDSWCTIDDGELFVKGMHISPYDKGNVFNRDPFRVRKLLMHKREIMRLLGKVKQEGLTLIPLSLYFKKNHVKLEMGLCKGKQLHDKREDMARRDAAREIQRAMKIRQR